MAFIHESELGAMRRGVPSDADGWVQFNEEHVVRLVRHTRRMLRARPEDDFFEAVLGHLWDGTRIVAMAWGYVPTLGTQAVALLEMERAYRDANGDWPPRRFDGSTARSLARQLQCD
jgi:hypothetical protein